MKNCQLCDILVLSDAEEAVAASGCFEEQLWMGNYCPGKNHSRRPWRGYCTVPPRTLAVVQLRLTRVSERHLHLREHSWQGWKMDWQGRDGYMTPVHLKSKEWWCYWSVSRRKEKWEISFSVQNAFKLQQTRELWPFVARSQYPGHLEAIENYKTLISQCAIIMIIPLLRTGWTELAPDPLQKCISNCTAGPELDGTKCRLCVIAYCHQPIKVTRGMRRARPW